MISVALGTFNGERFLADQLESLRAQSYWPGELVVQDDASTDATAALVEQFAARAPFPVHLDVNPTNLGSTANFERAIRRCRGDVIALCDQDDIWLPAKLARIEAAFAARPECGFVFSDAELLSEAGTSRGSRLWASLGGRDVQPFREGHAFESLLRRNMVTGATLAFRNEYRDLLLPMPRGWVHDGWIALLIAAVAPCEPLSEPLIHYRQHAAQQIGGGNRGLWHRFRHASSQTRGTYRQVHERFAEALARLTAWPGVRHEVLEALAGKVAHVDCRARMRESRSWRLPAILGELHRGHYRRYSHGWLSAVQDALLS